MALKPWKVGFFFKSWGFILFKVLKWRIGTKIFQFTSKDCAELQNLMQLFLSFKGSQQMIVFIHCNERLKNRFRMPCLSSTNRSMLLVQVVFLENGLRVKQLLWKNVFRLYLHLLGTQLAKMCQTKQKGMKLVRFYMEYYWKSPSLR